MSAISNLPKEKGWSNEYCYERYLFMWWSYVVVLARQVRWTGNGTFLVSNKCWKRLPRIRSFQIRTRSLPLNLFKYPVSTPGFLYRYHQSKSEVEPKCRLAIAACVGWRGDFRILFLDILLENTPSYSTLLTINDAIDDERATNKIFLRAGLQEGPKQSIPFFGRDTGRQSIAYRYLIPYKKFNTN